MNGGIGHTLREEESALNRYNLEWKGDRWYVNFTWSKTTLPRQVKSINKAVYVGYTHIVDIDRLCAAFAGRGPEKAHFNSTLI